MPGFQRDRVGEREPGKVHPGPAKDKQISDQAPSAPINTCDLPKKKKHQRTKFRNKPKETHPLTRLCALLLCSAAL